MIAAYFLAFFLQNSRLPCPPILVHLLYIVSPITDHRGHVDIVDLLIKRNASCTSRTASNATAMHLAAGSGRHDICQMLYEASSAEVSSSDCEGTRMIRFVRLLL
jgi:ankyrin repeat protein